MKRSYQLAMLMLSILSLTILLTGCQTQVKVIPADKEVTRIMANKPFTPAINGWFIPDARMLDIVNQLEKK